MKKICALLITFITIMTISAACQPQKEAEQFGDKYKATISLDYDAPGMGSLSCTNTDLICLAAPKPIEEITQNAYIIVKAGLEKTQKVELDYSCSLGTLSEYEFTIKEFLKGSTDEEKLNLEMYSIITGCRDCGDQKEIFEEGGEYILFIGKRQSIYRGDSYWCDSLIFRVKGDRVEAQYQHGRRYDKRFFRTVGDFKEFLAKTVEDTGSSGKITGCGYIETEDIRDIVEFSHVIAKVKLKECVFANTETNLSSVIIENMETFKGELPESMSVILFNEDVVLNGEAIILLTCDAYENGEGYEYAPSSRNSVIYGDDPRYEEYQANIGLDWLLNGEWRKKYSDENSFLSPEDAAGDILICDLSEKNFIDIEGAWEIAWEAAERADRERFNGYKDYSGNEKKDTFVFSRDGTGFFEHGGSEKPFTWRYILEDGRKIGVVLEGGEIKPQRMIFLGPEEDSFVFRRSFTNGSDRKYGMKFIRKAGLKKVSPHIIISGEGIYMPRAYPAFSCHGGLCADMVPFYMFDEPAAPKVYEDADVEITASGGEGEARISFRVYDGDYTKLYNNSNKLTAPDKKGEYTVGIVVSWGTKEEYDGYEFLMGLNIQ